MSQLRRIVLARHGETDGNSSVRFHGSGDVPLSQDGKAQMRALAGKIQNEVLDVVVASPLRRSWRGAWLASRGQAVRLEPDFREIHFGRWEGKTADEIQASDPVLYEDWQAGREGFEFPGGEPRGEFRARIKRGLDRLLASDSRGALLVVHKGVIRVLLEELTGETIERGRPELGEIIGITRSSGGAWSIGRRSSDPPGLE
jgi:probable phosphoglycerate mutase